MSRAHHEMAAYFQHLGPKLTRFHAYPEAWRHRIRTVNLAEPFFARLQTFIRRFPGWLNEDHIEQLLAFFVTSSKLYQKTQTRGNAQFNAKFQHFYLTDSRKDLIEIKY